MTDGKDSNDENNDYKVGYGKPPKYSRFKTGQSGNPRGRPKKEDPRLSPEHLGSFIRHCLLSKEIDVRKGNKVEKIPIIHAVMTQLGLKAAKGDMKAIKMIMDHALNVAKENAGLHLDFMMSWNRIKRAKLDTESNKGTLEHLEACHDYFGFKKSMREIEPVEDWPFEPDEPRTNEDWTFFITCLKEVRNHRRSYFPWPLKYPSQKEDLLSHVKDIENMTEVETVIYQQKRYHHDAELRKQGEDIPYEPMEPRTIEDWYVFKKFVKDVQDGEKDLSQWPPEDWPYGMPDE